MAEPGSEPLASWEGLAQVVALGSPRESNYVTAGPDPETFKARVDWLRRKHEGSMVERVARTLYALTAKDGPPWSSGRLYDERELYRQHARAVIDAMREPTEAMKKATTSNGDNIYWDYSCHVCGGLKDGWHAMIDAALADEGPA